MRLHSLRLHAPELAPIRDYYVGKLGLPVTHESEREISVQVGWTTLSFVVGAVTPRTSYHIAFNIPENQLEAGKAWIEARIPIRTHEGRDTYHFESWNADASYFDDPFDNVLEIIARHTLPTASNVPFSTASLLCVSEIGLPTTDVLADAARYCEQLGVRVFADSHYPEFTAVGDDEGLLILAKRGRIWSPNTGVQAHDLPAALHVIDSAGRVVSLIGS